MRRVPNIPAPDASILEHVPNPKSHMDLHIEVVTPMFGGSATAGEVDLERPISAKSIRGHLRFWWRACRAPHHNSAQKMFEAEEGIWGSTAQPSTAELEIISFSPGREIEWYSIDMDLKKGRFVGKPTQEGRPYPAYALFPFQGEIKDNGQTVAKPPDRCRTGMSFTLRVKYVPEQHDDVSTALQAWILFGGVGARTRRGCGSLFCSNWTEHFGEFSSDPKTLLPADLMGRLRPGAVPFFPTLDQAALLLGETAYEHLSAWRDPVNLMRDFRQREDYARNVGQSSQGPHRPGKSRWPEPDSIRELSGCLTCKHKPNGAALQFYPRADLGLPILFQFRGCSGCPDTHTLGLNDNATGRMASPIILKPLAISATDSKPLVLLLNTPHVWESDRTLVVKPNHGLKPLLQADVENPTKSASVTPMMGIQNARESFLAFVESEVREERVIL